MSKAPTHKNLQKRILELEQLCTARANTIEELAKYRDIISSTTDGIAFLDENYRYVVVNDAYELFSGLKRHELIGLTVADYLGKDVFNHSIKPHFDRCMTGEIVHYQEWINYPILGQRFVDITYSPYRDSNNAICGVIASTRDITERKHAETEQQITMTLLHLLHEETDGRDLAGKVTGLMREWSGCEAVGIRLREGEDYPYYETRGFPSAFVNAETRLTAVDDNGEFRRECNDEVILECMCGSVIKGRFNEDDLPCFTSRGSFWTNSTTELLNGFAGDDQPIRLRGHCNAAGYESVALVPLLTGKHRLGLLQFNDRQKDRFDERIITLLERLASYLALGFLQRKTAKVLRESEDKYKGLVNNLPGTAYQFRVTERGEQRFTFIGEGCYELFGLHSEEIQANSSHMLDRIPQRDADAVQQAIAQSAKTLCRYDLEHRVIHNDGRIIWIRAISTPKKLTGGDIIWDGIAIDITKRKEAEADLLQSYNDILMREQIAKHFLISAHDDLFNDVLDLLLGRFEAGYGYIGYIDKSGDLVCPSMTRETWEDCRLPDKSTTFPQKSWGGIWGESLQQKITILRNQHLKTPKKHIRIDNALVVPLLVNGELVGQIALANKVDGFTQADQWQLESFADFISPLLKIYLEKEEMNRQLLSSLEKLKQTNIALNVMIDNRRDEKKELCRIIQKNFDELVFPYHETVTKSHSKEEILTILDIIKQNTETSLLSLDLPAPADRQRFSPKETQVAHLIKIGKSSKEIASILRMSLRSVFFHRNNIRKKLNIHKNKTNLRSFLAQLDL